MILPDVNVLICAFRQDVPEHAICRPWLENVVRSEARFRISRLALADVVRVTTNTRERHWDIFQRLCIETNTRGRRVIDAWYAALAIEWGREWITFDRDFARFPGLKWRTPSATG